MRGYVTRGRPLDNDGQSGYEFACGYGLQMEVGLDGKQEEPGLKTRIPCLFFYAGLKTGGFAVKAQSASKGS